jgi:hypothetical protein
MVDLEREGSLEMKRLSTDVFWNWYPSDYGMMRQRYYAPWHVKETPG